ncbi:hypothetical protein Nepgr_028302 [Nepenthes gracilis]|uniref:RHOMBOID-like protein n=1 Tax=Nepenthes gracilis TaxID=150966 RepID=A0AAD3Y3Z4_NEPGR|nr:hypothetical protein Nepgr_028302 [Nepenthes gracilis]
MSRYPSQEIPVRLPSTRASQNTIHPVDSTPLRPCASPSHSPIVYHEVKHFKKWFPWLIPSFVVANTIVFIVTMYVNDCPKYTLSCVAPFLGRFSFQPFKENPLLGPSSTTLEKMGALDVNKVVHGHQGWRLISCIWLHGGVFHILANMLSLLIIGIRMEQEFGFVKVGLLYIISGFGGSLLSALFVRLSISVGASGALFGLLGGMLSELIINWTIYTNKVASFLLLVVTIVVNLAIGILPHVDNFAHIGGFLSGFLLGFVLLIRPQFGWVSQRYMPQGYSLESVKPKFKTYQFILWIISLILLIVGFTVVLVMLFRGVNGNDHCSWCHYLSCVPTSRWSCQTQPSYCVSNQLGNQLNLTCQSNGKSSIYYLSNITESQIQGLCTELCN